MRFVAAIMSLASLPGAVRAEVPVVIDAEGDAFELPYELAKRRLRDRDFAAAVLHFERALEQARTDEQAWSALLGLALTHELAGDLLAASVGYRRFLASSGRSTLASTSEWAARRVESAETIARLETALAPTHARVELVSVPESAVAIEPAIPHACAQAPCTLFVPPGAFRFRFSAVGHEPASRSIDANAGERHPLSVALVPLVDSENSDPAARADLRLEQPDAGLPPASVASFAVSGAALTLSAVFFGLAASDHSDLRALSRQPGTELTLAAYDRTLDRMQDRELVAWTAGTTAVVALGVGLLSWLLP